MRANLWRKNLLFKAKSQLANSRSGYEGYERHNIEVGGQMHSGETKIADLVGEHLKKKKKRVRVRTGSRKRMREQIPNLFSESFFFGRCCSYLLIIYNTNDPYL
jgi:hypothetical protein